MHWIPEVLNILHLQSLSLIFPLKKSELHNLKYHYKHALTQIVLAGDQPTCMNTREVESIFFRENPNKLIKANFDSTYTLKQLYKSYTTLEISPSIIQAKDGYEALNQLLDGIKLLSTPTCEWEQGSIVSTYTFNINGSPHTLRVIQKMDTDTPSANSVAAATHTDS